MSKPSLVSHSQRYLEVDRMWTFRVQRTVMVWRFDDPLEIKNRDEGRTRSLWTKTWVGMGRDRFGGPKGLDISFKSESHVSKLYYYTGIITLAKKPVAVCSVSDLSKAATMSCYRLHRV